MPNCSVHSIRVRWFKLSAAPLAAAALGVTVWCLPAAVDPLMDLKAGVAAYEGKRYPAAISTLEPLTKQLPKLADYVLWFTASAQFESKNFAAASKTLEPVWKQTPASPLAARALLLAAKADLQSGDAQAALTLLRANYAALPQPQGDSALAAAFAAVGDPVSAAIYDQRVYFGFPLTAEAAQAGDEIAKLRTALGDTYPPAMAASMLGRALKLLDAGQNARARKELEALVPQLAGSDRDVARVRIGVADYNANLTAAAHRYLETLEVAEPEAAAERLYYLLACARRLPGAWRH
jgi:predicted negative regulator of RcsB-dependent stress response